MLFAVNIPLQEPREWMKRYDGKIHEPSRKIYAACASHMDDGIGKIIQAIDRIDGGIFGECSSCGEDIGLKRMKARSMATLCIDCKGEQEQQERRNA